MEFGAPASAGGQKRLPILIRASVFSLGEQTLPAMEWRLLGPDGSAKMIASPPVRVTITPPKLDENDTGELRPIKGPYEPPLWPWLTSAALLLLAAGAAFYWFYLRRRIAAVLRKKEPVDTRTFEEIALDEIETLPGLGLSPKGFYGRLSEIVRLYLERRCGILAMRMTSYDLNRELRRARLDDQARMLTKRLLGRCDLAKFARHCPKDSQYPEDCGTAKEIICILSPVQRDAGSVQDMASSPPGGKP